MKTIISYSTDDFDEDIEVHLDDFPVRVNVGDIFPLVSMSECSEKLRNQLSEKAIAFLGYRDLEVKSITFEIYPDGEYAQCVYLEELS